MSLEENIREKAAVANPQEKPTIEFGVGMVGKVLPKAVPLVSNAPRTLNYPSPATRNRYVFDPGMPVNVRIKEDVEFLLKKGLVKFEGELPSKKAYMEQLLNPAPAPEKKTPKKAAKSKK